MPVDPHGTPEDRLRTTRLSGGVPGDEVIEASARGVAPLCGGLAGPRPPTAAVYQEWDRCILRAYTVASANAGAADAAAASESRLEDLQATFGRLAETQPMGRLAQGRSGRRPCGLAVSMERCSSYPRSAFLDASGGSRPVCIGSGRLSRPRQGGAIRPQVGRGGR